MAKAPAKLDLETLLKILSILRKIDMSRLLDVPDVTDSKDTREWVRAVVNTAEFVTVYTEVTFDDEIVKQIKVVVESDEYWSSIHSLVLFVYNLFVEKKSIQAALDDADVKKRVDATAKAVGLAPVIVLAIVQACLTLLRLVQEWRDRQVPRLRQQA